jgi:hypothetical protein
MPDKVIVLRGPGNIVKTTASGITAGTSITVSTTAGITAGMAVTGDGVSTTATVVSVGANSVVVSAGNTASFTSQTVFFTEWNNLLVSGESIVTSSIFSTISASEAYISVSAFAQTLNIGGTTASGRVIGSASLSTSSWVSAASAGFVVKADVTVSGVTGSDFPQLAFNRDTYAAAADAELSLVESGPGKLTIFGQTTPSSTVSFDFVVIKG